MRFNKLQDWLDWQEALHSQKIELGLERIAEVAQALGVSSPTYKIITVAGTNGKGSIVTILESIYHHSGYRVGSYTSPHLLHYNERIRIAKENVDDERLCKAFDLVDKARGNTSLSYFEFGTLAAMQIFNEQEFDVVIYEVGLGGRLDAVNILDADLAIVSNIGIDHVQWLGETRESIGYEKAGVFRAARPAVCGDEDPPDTLLNYAEKLGTQLFCINKEFTFQQSSQTNWEFETHNLHWENLPIPNLYGRTQLGNAATALMGVRCMDDDLPVTRDNINSGLANISLLGRFQIIQDGSQIILDVAHNLDSAKALVENLAGLEPANKTIAVFAVLADKDVEGILEVTKEVFDEWNVSELSSERSLSVGDLERSIHKFCSGQKVHTHASIKQAYDYAKQDVDASTRIVVFGSFLTVAEVLKQVV